MSFYFSSSFNNLTIERMFYTVFDCNNDGFVHFIADNLADSGVSCIDFKGVTANPRISQAKRGVAMCLENGIDVIVALGGGSVIDCATVIAAGV